MTRAAFLLLTLGFLASCGADGAPVPPAAPAAVTPGATISGTLSTGIAINGTGG